jgi:hypothetical protein
MRWFRHWLGRPARAAAQRPPSFRPFLERLEDRRVMNVSSAIDVHGNVLQLVVNNNNTLLQTYQGVTTVLAQDVFRAHAYRDSNGTIGFTVVYGPDSNFSAFDYDHTGAHYLGTNIQDVDKAYDRAGHLQEDVTYEVNGQFSTFEYTDTGARQITYNTNVYVELLIHPFADSQGKMGEDVSYFSTQSDNVLIEYDATGGHFLAKNAVADHAWNVQGTTFVLDVVYIAGAAYEYTPTSATHLGDDFRI